MEQATPPARRYTVEEYMHLEEWGDIRHEFFEGEVFPVASEGVRHNLLVGNCVMPFWQALRGRPGYVFAGSVQLEVEKGRYYNYPDVLVTCAAADVSDLTQRTVTAPLLVMEVLSEATENRDRSWKFDQYRKLSSLQHYFLVWQSACLVEWFRREENNLWSFTPLARLADEIVIPELGVTLRLQDIYEDTGLTQMSIFPNPEAENERD